MAMVLQARCTFERACFGRLVLRKKSRASAPDMRPSPSRSASANQASTVASGTSSTATPLLAPCVDAPDCFPVNHKIKFVEVLNPQSIHAATSKMKEVMQLWQGGGNPPEVLGASDELLNASNGCRCAAKASVAPKGRAWDSCAHKI